MNNFSVLWDFTKFNSESEAKSFCLSKKCKDHISYLDGLAHSLHETGLTEPKTSQGHGYPVESNSSMEASYVSAEASRLRDLRKYFKGEPARPGYKWIYSTHGLHSVNIELDLKNATSNHPVFLEYIKGQNFKGSKKESEFQYWLKEMSGPTTMNSMFKMAYRYKMVDLFPDGTTLQRITKKT